MFGPRCSPERILLKSQEPAFLKQVILIKNYSRTDLILHRRTSGKYGKEHHGLKAVLGSSLMGHINKIQITFHSLLSILDPWNILHSVRQCDMHNIVFHSFKQ